MSPRPVVVCGRTAAIAKAVRRHLLPEYEAIHICLDAKAGAADIPLLLSGKMPANHNDNLGSQNYGQAPVAVAMGGAFDDEAFDQINDACKAVEGVKQVPWLRLDKTKPPTTGQAAVGQAPTPEMFEAFAEGTAKRVKDCLGREDVKGEGVFYY